MSIIRILWTNNFKAPIINIKVAQQIIGITADWTKILSRNMVH